MKTILYIFIITVLLSFFSNCSQGKKAIAKPESNQISMNTGLYDIWRLKEIKSKPINKDKSIVLELNTDKMSFMGNAFCNTIAGKIELNSSNKIQFKKMIATRMACEALADENLYLNLLSTVSSYQIKSLHLLLFNDSNELVLDFIKMD